MIPVEAQVCHIPFGFENSCKSCFGWKTSPLNIKTQVYVNFGGVAVRFDKAKVRNKARQLGLKELGMKRKVINNISNKESLRSGMVNLNRVIEYNARLSHRNVAEFRSEIIQLVGAFLDEENPCPLTIDLIRRVNAALYEIFY